MSEDELRTEFERIMLERSSCEDSHEFARSRFFPERYINPGIQDRYRLFLDGYELAIANHAKTTERGVE